MGDTILETSLVDSVVVPLESALTLDPPVHKLSTVDSELCPQFVPADLLISLELAFVELFSFGELSNSFHFAIYKVSFINLAISPFKDSFSMLHTSLKGSYVGVSVWERLFSLSVRHTCLPLPSISRSLCRSKGTLPFEQRSIHLPPVEGPIWQYEYRIF